VTVRSSLAALAASAFVFGATACALDFDRFQPGSPPVDASLAASADSPNGTLPPDGASEDVVAEPTGPTGPTDDAGTTESGADEDAPSDGSTDTSSCTPSPACLSSARDCATTCTQQEQQCAMRCTGIGGTGCRSSCNRTESTCFTQCDNTCSTCTRSAGCVATADCADASR
jgi:hypothetical protein